MGWITCYSWDSDVFFLLKSSVIVLFSNFLLLFCVYMLSIFLFLILYSVRSFLLLMCGRVL